MYTDVFVNHKDLFSNLLYLSTVEIKNPQLVFEDFCGEFSLPEVRKILAVNKQEIATGKSTVYMEAIDRSNAIFFLETIERIAEAAFALQNKHQKTS